MKQILMIAARLFPDVVSGKKRSTIRWNEPRIAPGYMRYICVDDPQLTIVVWVTKCTDMPLSSAAAYLGRDEEWPLDVMVAGMREHYPAIQATDTVQIVEHLSPDETARRPDFEPAP